MVGAVQVDELRATGGGAEHVDHWPNELSLIEGRVLIQCHRIFCCVISPKLFSYCRPALLAQLVERRNSNHEVRGSIPAEGFELVEGRFQKIGGF
eukprot:845448-Prymnesium_polylepis.1